MYPPVFVYILECFDRMQMYQFHCTFHWFCHLVNTHAWLKHWDSLNFTSGSNHEALTGCILLMWGRYGATHLHKLGSAYGICSKNLTFYARMCAHSHSHSRSTSVVHVPVASDRRMYVVAVCYLLLSCFYASWARIVTKKLKRLILHTEHAFRNERRMTL